MVEEKKGKWIYICGPAYHLEERKILEKIANYLESNGYNTYLSNRDGIETDLLQLTSSGNLDYGAYDIISRISFGLEIYEIIENCDFIFFSLNGRTPDEAGIFKAAVAFGAGKPVINYKFDVRMMFPNGVNPMISGLSHKFKIVKKKLPKIIKRISKLQKIFRKYGENPYKGDIIPPHIQNWINLGRDVAKYLKEIQWAENKLSDSDGLIQKIINRFKDNDIMKSLKPNIESNKSEDIKGKKVYCSGALFCPAEISENSIVAKTLEEAGYDTYLPQRDGGEAFVMNSIDNPFAGSNFVRPIANFLSKSMFALDIYEILKCDYFLINLNGRVPDGGAISELGVAFAMGKPIIQFKTDVRSLFQGKNHPMISEAAFNIPPVSQLGKLANAIEQTVQYVNSFGSNQYKDDNIPLSVQKTINRGFKVWKFIHDKKKPENKMATLI